MTCNDPGQKTYAGDKSDPRTVPDGDCDSQDATKYIKFPGTDGEGDIAPGYHSPNTGEWDKIPVRAGGLCDRGKYCETGV